VGRPLRVGLTGGIGSGKSYVASLFAQLAVPVIDADQIAREQSAPGTEGLAGIVALLGPQVLDAQGLLRRDMVRELIFKDPERRRLIEDLLHPRIRAVMEERTRHIRAPYCLLVIPLLTEAHQRDLVDRVLVVDASVETQIRRVRQRDTLTIPEVNRILDAQASRESRLQIADEVIENDDETRDLIPTVKRLHERYLALAATSK